jgi:phosphoenolpyruvate carboxylase
MKKKVISLFLAAVLVFGLSMTATAAAAASPKTAAAAANQSGDIANIRQLTAVILDDRQTLLSVESTNIQLTLKLRSLIAGLKKKGSATLSQEALNQLKSLQSQIKQLENTLVGSKGQISKQLNNFKQYRKAKDFTNAASALEQVFSEQKARIVTKTDINELLRQMIAILSAA